MIPLSFSLFLYFCIFVFFYFSYFYTLYYLPTPFLCPLFREAHTGRGRTPVRTGRSPSSPHEHRSTSYQASHPP